MAYSLTKRVSRLEKTSLKHISPLVISLWNEKCEQGGFEGYKTTINGVLFIFKGRNRDEVIQKAIKELPVFYQPVLIELFPL